VPQNTIIFAFDPIFLIVTMNYGLCIAFHFLLALFRLQLTMENHHEIRYIGHHQLMFINCGHMGTTWEIMLTQKTESSYSTSLRLSSSNTCVASPST